MLTLVANRGQIFEADYDFAKQILYWYDREGQNFSTVSLKDSQRPIRQAPDVFTGDVGLSFGMAIDWIHNNLYWLNRDTSSVNVMNLDSGNKAVLVVGALQRPVAMVVDPRDGQG